jgi:hypothetical protein
VFLLMASAIIAWWFINVPWEVREEDKRILQLSQKIWRGSPGAPPYWTDAKVDWSAWVVSGVVHFGLIALLWIVVRSVAHNIRLHEGKCWNCGYDRHGLGRQQTCPECGSSSVPHGAQ